MARLWPSEAAVLISIIQETARTARQLHLYLPIWLVPMSGKFHGVAEVTW